MLRFISILGLSFFLIMGLAACGGGDDTNDTDENATTENGDGNTADEGTDEGDTAGGDTVDVAAAEESYQANCSSCHGGNLEGVANFPALETIGERMDKEAILEKIKVGGGGMPPEIIEGEEAENVAAWLATMK